LAAHRAGASTVVLPRRNEKNLREDVPAEVREAMTFHLVDAIDEVIDLALEESIPIEDGVSLTV
jgi:ATP-dependent Lon protease